MGYSREPVNIEDSNKIDLARLFIHCYGVNYIDHPRMEKLLMLNNIQAKDYLNDMYPESWTHIY